MDVTQILLVVVITALTILLVVIGIQVVYILQEVRKSIMKMNKMLDDAGSVTGSVSKTVVGAAGMLEGLKTGLSFMSLFTGKKKKERGNG